MIATFTMTKAEKIAVLDKAMTVSKRDDGTEYHHFTDDAPRELQDLYLEHYEVRDDDYARFMRAIEIVADVFDEDNTSRVYHEENHMELEGTEDDRITDAIYEEASESASIWNEERLSYLNIWNEEEISQEMRDTGEHSIAQACANWYDRQVEQAAIIIKDWVLKA